MLLRGRCPRFLLVLIGGSTQHGRGLESAERWVLLAPDHCKGNQESASPSHTRKIKVGRVVVNADEKNTNSQCLCLRFC